MFSLGEGRQTGDLVAVYHCLMGGYREDAARLFLDIHKLEHGKILLDMRGKKFTIMIVNC